MPKRKHQALDDLKAADILTNLVGVPRVGEEGDGAAADAAATAAASGSGATSASKSKTAGGRRSGTGSKKPSGGGDSAEMPPLGMDDAVAQAIAASAVDIATGGDGNVKAPGERKSADPRFKQFHEDRWDYMLSEMLEFREANGHCLVPHTFPANPQLARWVKRQRRQYKLMNDGKTSTMTPERAAVLEQEGFVWDSHDAAWKEKIADLRRYRAQTGHTLVPSSYKPNPHLATWVKCQRRQYKLYQEGKSSAMNPKRIVELEKEGFVWEIRSGAGNLKKAPAGAAGGAATKAPAAASTTLAANGHGRASMTLPAHGAMPHHFHAAAAAAAAAATTTTGGVLPMHRPMPTAGMAHHMPSIGFPPHLPSAGVPPPLPVGYAAMAGTLRPAVPPVPVPPAAPAVPVAASAPPVAPPPLPAAALPPPMNAAAPATSAATSNADKKVEANNNVEATAEASV